MIVIVLIPSVNKNIIYLVARNAIRFSINTGSVPPITMPSIMTRHTSPFVAKR